MCFIPRRALSVSECEIARAYKVAGSVIEPIIAFIVPRESYQFQSDIYGDPPACSPLSQRSLRTSSSRGKMNLNLRTSSTWTRAPSRCPPPPRTRTASASAPAPIKTAVSTSESSALCRFYACFCTASISSSTTMSSVVDSSSVSFPYLYLTPDEPNTLNPSRPFEKRTRSCLPSSEKPARIFANSNSKIKSLKVNAQKAMAHLST